MATSFKKKSSRGRSVFIPGTRPSLHNNQLLVSTGIPSMDAVIGGGVAVGTVVMIEEDNYGSYARQILKYFLAEGVVSGHGLFLASADIDPQTILKDLPHPLDHGDDNTDSTNQEDTMKIAWRYQQKSKVQSNPSHNRFGHYYDLSRVMDEKKLDTIPVRMFNAAEECTSDSPKNSRSNSLYEKLLSEVNSTITDGGYSTTAAKQQQERSILRIAIHSLGSQLWGEECGATCVDFSPALPWFLYSLRATLRSSLVVCMVTIPTHVFQDSGFTHRIERLCDTVLALESFAGSDKETNPLYRDYHGLFNIVRLPRLNTLTTHMPDSLDLAFKLKRKKFSIETLHLPPDLSESVSRNQEEAIRPKPGALACQTGSGNSKLDF